MTKWFFALSEASLAHPDHDWVALIRAAVASALDRTTLRPHFVYDGVESDFTAELRNMGVTVIHHRVTFYDTIAARRAELGPSVDPIYLAIAAGAFLRVEIPLLEHEDEFVLYTDCDTMFLRNPPVQDYRPAYFSCAPQRNPADAADMNSGVMVMNLPALRRDLPDFTRFIGTHLNSFTAFDQDAYSRYYTGRFDPLPPRLNWKPYWGFNPNAEIVHFHGPKPAALRRMAADPSYKPPQVWQELFNENVEGYRIYLEQWDEFGAAADRLVRRRPALAQ